MKDPLASKPTPRFGGGNFEPVTGGGDFGDAYYTGGTPTRAYDPGPQITRMRPVEDFSRAGVAKRRWSSIDEWMKVSKTAKAVNKPIPGKLSRPWISGVFIDRAKVREAELFEQITSRETVPVTNPAVQSLVRDLRSSGVNVTAQDIAKTVRMVDLTTAAKAVLSRTRMNADGTMTVDARGVNNIVLSLQESNPQLAGLLGPTVDAMIQEQVATAAGVAEQALKDENVVGKAQSWMGENLALPAMDLLMVGSNVANQTIRATYRGLQQSENPLDFAKKYIMSVANPASLALLVSENWDAVQVGKWDEKGLNELRTVYPPGRVNAAIDFSRSIQDGDPDRIFRMMTESGDPEYERFLEGIIYAGEDGEPVDPEMGELLRLVDEKNLGSTGQVVTSAILGDMLAGSTGRETLADITSFGAAFVDPLVVLGPAYRMVLLARYSITKIGPGMAAGYRAALASQKVGGIEMNRARSYWVTVLREIDRTEDTLAQSRVRGSGLMGRVMRQHKEIPPDVIEWVTKNVPRSENGRQIDDLIISMEHADAAWIAENGAISTRAQNVAAAHMAQRLLDEKLIDHLDEIHVDADDNVWLRTTEGPNPTQGSLDTPIAVKLDIPAEIVEDMISLRNTVMGRNMPEHFSARITSRAQQRDMLMPRRGVVADLRIRTVNRIMLNEHLPNRRMNAFVDQYLYDVENADDIQQVFADNALEIGVADRRLTGRGSLPGRVGAVRDEVSRYFASLPNQSYIYLKDARDADTFYKMARTMFSKDTADYLTQAFIEASPGTRRLMVASTIRSGAAARGVNLTKEEVLGRLDNLATGTREGEMYAIQTADRPSVLAVQATLRDAQTVARKRGKDLRRVERSERNVMRLQTKLEEELDELNKLEGARVSTPSIEKLRKKIAAAERQVIRQRGRVTKWDAQLQRHKDRFLRHMAEGQKEKPSRTQALIDEGEQFDQIIPGQFAHAAWTGHSTVPVLVREVDFIDDIDEFLPPTNWWENIPPRGAASVEETAVAVPEGEAAAQTTLTDEGTIGQEVIPQETPTVGVPEAPGAQTATAQAFDIEGMTPPGDNLVGGRTAEMPFDEAEAEQGGLLILNQEGPGKWVVRDDYEGPVVATYPTYAEAAQHPGLNLHRTSGSDMDIADDKAWDAAVISEDGTIEVTLPSSYYVANSGDPLKHTIRFEGDNQVVRTENPDGKWVEITWKPEVGKAPVPNRAPEDFPDWIPTNERTNAEGKVLEALRGNNDQVIDDAEKRGLVTPTTGRGGEAPAGRLPFPTEEVGTPGLPGTSPGYERIVGKKHLTLTKEPGKDDTEWYHVVVRPVNDAQWLADVRWNAETGEVRGRMGLFDETKDPKQQVQNKTNSKLAADFLDEMLDTYDIVPPKGWGEGAYGKPRPAAAAGQGGYRLSVMRADGMTTEHFDTYEEALRRGEELAANDGSLIPNAPEFEQPPYTEYDSAWQDGNRFGTIVPESAFADEGVAPTSPFTYDTEVVPGVVFKGYADGKLALAVDPTLIDDDDAYALVESMWEVRRMDIPPELDVPRGMILEEYGETSPMMGMPWTLTRSPGRPGQEIVYNYTAMSDDPAKPGNWDIAWTESGQMTTMGTPRELGKVGIDREQMAAAVEHIDELAVEHDITAPFIDTLGGADDFRKSMGLPPGRVAATTSADRRSLAAQAKPTFVVTRETEKVTESAMKESFKDKTIHVTKSEYPSGEVRYEARFGEGEFMGRVVWNDRGGFATSGFDTSIGSIEEWMRTAQSRGLDIPPPGQATTLGGLAPVHRSVDGLGTLESWLASYDEGEFQDILRTILDMQRAGNGLTDDMREFLLQETDNATAAYAKRAVQDPHIRNGYLESQGYGGDVPPTGAKQRFGEEFDRINAANDAAGTGMASRTPGGIVDGTQVDPPFAVKSRTLKDGTVQVVKSPAHLAWERSGTISLKMLAEMIRDNGEEATWAWWHTGQFDAYNHPEFLSTYGPSRPLLPEFGANGKKVSLVDRLPGEYLDSVHTPGNSKTRIVSVPWKQGKDLSARDQHIKARWETEAEAAIEEIEQGGDYSLLLKYLDDVRRAAIVRSEPTLLDEVVEPLAGERDIAAEIADAGDIDERLATIAERHPELVDGEDSPLQSYPDEETGEQLFDLVDDAHPDFIRAWEEAFPVEPPVQRPTVVGELNTAELPVPVPTAETPANLDMTRTLAQTISTIDLTAVPKRLRDSINRTKKFGTEARIAVTRSPQASSSAASGDIVPGEVVFLEEDFPAYLYHHAYTRDLVPVDPDDYTKGFVWLPASYEDEVAEVLSQEARYLPQHREHLAGLPEGGWRSIHDEYVDEGSLDTLRAIDDAGVTDDEIKAIGDPKEKAKYDKSYGGTPMSPRSNWPANWMQAVRNIIDRGLADDLLGYTRADLDAARKAVASGQPYTPPTGRGLIWERVAQNNDPEKGWTEKVTGLTVKRRATPKRKRSLDEYPLSPKDEPQYEWLVEDVEGVEVMSGFRSEAAAKRAVQDRLRPATSSQQALDEAEMGVASYGNQQAGGSVPASEDTVEGVVTARVDNPIPADEAVAGAEPASVSPPGRPPNPPGTGGPSGLEGPGNPPNGAGGWRPNPITDDELEGQWTRAIEWVEGNSAGGMWSPSKGPDGRESALHVSQTSDYVGIPHMSEIEAIRRWQSNPIGQMLGETAQYTTDKWSLWTLYGFRFAQRSTVEDLMVYTMTGGLGHINDLRRGYAMSQSVREATPHIRTEIDKETKELVLLTQNDKTSLSRLGIGKKRIRQVGSTRTGAAVDRGLVRVSKNLGKWIHLKNLEAVQTWLAPYLDRTEVLRAAQAAQQGNRIPIRRLIVQAAGRMKLSKLQPRHIEYLGDLAESHTGIKIIESVAEDSASAIKGTVPTMHSDAIDLADVPDLEFVRPTNPVVFGDFKRVGVAAEDEREIMGTFFWHRKLQEIVSTDGPIGKIAVTYIDNPPQAKAAVAQAIRDDETFGYRDIYSLIGDNQAIDEFADRYVEDVLTYFQNADGSINHTLRNKFIEPYIREDGTEGFTVEWTAKTASGMDRLRVTHETLSRLPKVNQPQYVLGREVKAIPYPTSEKALMSDRMWGWMGAQYARMAKEPIFLSSYVSNRDALAPIQQRLAQQFAEAAGRTTPSASDIRLATMHVDKQAQDAAYSFTLAYTDNPRNRSVLAWKVRNVARYYRATEDFYRRTLRIAKNYPDSFYRLALTYQAFDDTGFSYRDENGDLYFAYPMNGLLQDALATALSGLPGGTDFRIGSAVDPFLLGGKVKGISPSTDPAQWMPTLSGPAGVIPATFFIQRFPGMQGLKTLLLGQYSEAGQTGNEFAELVAAVMPAGVVKAMGVLNQDELDSTVDNASAAALSIIVANGDADWDPADPMTSARMEKSDTWLEADKIGISLAMSKMMLGISVPASPQVYQNNVSRYARDAGIAGMKPLFRELLDRHDGDFAGAMTDFVKLERDNGADNYLPFTVSTYETPVTSLAGLTPLTATDELKAWAEGPEGTYLREKYPDAYTILAPKNGQFSYAGWSFLTATGYKAKKETYKVVRDILAADAGYEYQQQKKAIDAEIALQDKTTDEGKAEIARLEDGKSAILGSLVNANPFLREQRDELGLRYSANAIDAVRLQAFNMIQDAIERGSEDPAVHAISVAFDTFTEFEIAKDGYSAYSNEGKASRLSLDVQLSEQMAALGAVDPRVQSFIENFLMRD